MIISIDGPAGSGKSTVASLLAEKLGFVHFNSGKLYRGITAYLVHNNFPLEGIENKRNLSPILLETKFIKNVQHVYVCGTDFTPYLKDNIISVNTPRVSKNPYIRSVVDVCQRTYAKNNNVVIDGRDIGSFVFPNADYKFYLDCAIEERANRRFKELNETVPYSQLLKEIAERDEIDKNKKVAPLVIPVGAIVIDSTHLSIKEVVDIMLSHIKLKNLK